MSWRRSSRRPATSSPSSMRRPVRRQADHRGRDRRSPVARRPASTASPRASGDRGDQYSIASSGMGLACSRVAKPDISRRSVSSAAAAARAASPTRILQRRGSGAHCQGAGASGITSEINAKPSSAAASRSRPSWCGEADLAIQQIPELLMCRRRVRRPSPRSAERHDVRGRIPISRRRRHGARSDPLLQPAGAAAVIKTTVSIRCRRRGREQPLPAHRHRHR